MRLDRLLAIVIKLLNQERISARALAHEHEVTVRTIYRDVEAINLAGIPIISYAGNQGGFGIMPNYKLDRQVFTLQDMVSLLSVLRGFHGAFGDNKIRTVADKIQTLVPREKSREVQARLEQVVVDMLPWGISERQKTTLHQIQQAISSCQVLQFNYCNNQGERTKRQAEPMTLILKGYGWYLFAYCRLKQDFRIFRLSRMREIKTLQQRYIRKAQSYQPYLQSEFKPPKTILITLKFSAKMRHRAEDYFSPEQMRSGPAGSVVVQFRMPEDEGLYTFLLGLGEEIEVMNPLRLRQAVYARAEKIMHHYKPDIGLSQARDTLSTRKQKNNREAGQ